MDFSKRTVVVVGQNNASRRALQLALNLEGYGVHAAESTSEGRRLIEQHWPEAVVLDVGEGRPDVFLLARDIRRSTRHRHVVIVASAPLLYADHERAAYEAGCDAYVVQAGNAPDLAGLLESYLPGGGTLAEEDHAAKLWN